MRCWHCNENLIWGGDKECITNDDYSIVTNLTCPTCHSYFEVYLPVDDSPTDRIRHLEDALKEIRDIAHVSEGAEFYAMVADKALKGAK